MDTKEFLSRYLEKHGQISYFINGWNYFSYMKLKELTEMIDYGCKFENDTCKMYERGRRNSVEMCCCGGCPRTMGFLKSIPNEKSYVDEFYAKLFDEKFGYWRPGKGCILPRKFRSKTCLTFSCVGRESFPASIQALFSLIDSRDGIEIKNKETGKVLTDNFLIISFVEKWIKDELEQKH